MKLFDNDNSIYIYGYSNLGRNVYLKLHKLFPEVVKGIIVTEHNGKTRNIEHVYSIEEIEISSVNVIITMNPRHHNEIIANLKNRNCNNICIYNDWLDDKINRSLGELPLLETKGIVVCVGQACNLKCKFCGNFSPYACKDNMRYSFNQIRRNIDLLFSHFSKIDTVQIQGGEPFLHSELADLLEYIYVNYSEIIDRIQIATNGDIIPSPKVISILKNEMFDVRISNYKVVKNAEKLKRVFEENHICYHSYDFVSNDGKWNYLGDIKYIAKPKENLLEKVQKCSWCACYTLENGLVGRCSRSIPALDIQKVKFFMQDYLKVKEMTREEVGKYFMFIKPMECCKHCMGSEGEQIEAAVQLKAEEMEKLEIDS